MSAIPLFINATTLSYILPMAITASGSIYAQGNTTNTNIVVYNPSGTITTTITSVPNYYFCATSDEVNKLIHFSGFASLNRLTNTINTYGGSEVAGMTMGSDGNIYAVSQGGFNIFRINPLTGARTTIFNNTPAIFSDGDSMFSGCAFDSSGFLYCNTRSAGGLIYKFDISGTFLGLYGSASSQYNECWSLVNDPVNNMFYVSTLGGAVYRIDKYGNGALHGTFTGGSSYSMVYATHDKRLYISSREAAGASKIYRSTPIVPSYSGIAYTLNGLHIIKYYPFNTDTLNYSNISGPVNDTTLNGVSLVTMPTLLGGGSLLFSGVPNTAVTLSSLNFNQRGVTVSVWVRLNRINFNHQRIFDFGNGLGSDSFLLSCFYNRLELYVAGVSRTSVNTVVTDYNWHNYCVVVDASSNARVYIDGSAVQFTNALGDSITMQLSNFPYNKRLNTNFIGKDNFSSSAPLYGYVNNFFLFNRAFTAEEIAATSNINNTVTFQYYYPCFLEGSKILCLNLDYDEEEYVPVQKLKRGDLIKTATCGYKAISFIGRAKLPRPADDPNPKNRLYTFKSKGHQPLSITGEHCTLHKKLSDEKRQEVREYMGDEYITEDFYRVPACLDERAEPYTGKGPATIWHFALEHNNLYHNYAVYANGLLVETCSIDYLLNLSNMELL